MINLLPFRFKRLGDTYLLVNEVGQYKFVGDKDLDQLLQDPELIDEHLKLDLISTGFLCQKEYCIQALDELAIKLRTKKEFLQHFTTLHIVVLTHNCNSSCSYCHASSHASSVDHSLHMERRTARMVCEMIMQSPSGSIKVEFQGGEPTLNMEMLTYMVEYLTMLNKRAGKHLEFVLCTNLLMIDKPTIAYLKKHDIHISTSLDGPADIHDEQRRPVDVLSNYQLVAHNIQQVMATNGKDSLSALMTITKKSLPRLSDCVDTYISLGLDSIFFRPINPYGMAEKSKEYHSYTIDEYLTAYEEGLRYILDLNRDGTAIREEYATIFLRKILTPFSSGFVDIQSPPGNGISCAVYDIDGSVYVSDEARMLAKLGDTTFCIGNVNDNSYDQIFNGSKLRDLVKDHCIEADARCWDCPYIPYCGRDAVREYQEARLSIEQSNCRLHKGILDILFSLLKTDSVYESVLWSWVTARSLKEVLL